MGRGIVDIFAFQEALLIEVIFGIALFALLWAGFRRWLQHREKMSRLIADQTTGSAAQDSAQMKRIEARLNALEQALPDGSTSQPIPKDE